MLCVSRTTVGLISAFLPLAFAGSPPPLVSNGGFEEGFNGWQKLGNVALKSTVPYLPAEGASLAAFNSGNTAANGWLSKTVPTTAGATYRLGVHLGTLSYRSASQRLRLSVAGKAELLSKTLTVTGASGGRCVWTHPVFTFVADGSSVTLGFRDVSQPTDGIDLLLDLVTLDLVNLHPLRVNSSHGFPVEIAVSPADWHGAAGGPTPLERLFEHSSTVSLSAPRSHLVRVPLSYHGLFPLTYRFHHWQPDGGVDELSSRISFAMTGDMNLTAVYEPGPPIITEQPEDLAVPLGGAATFRVAVEAPGTNYQWWFNGNPIDNTNSPVLTIQSAGSANAGTYHVVCGDLGGLVESRRADLHVIAPPFSNGGFESGLQGWAATGNVRIISAPLYPATEGRSLANFNAGDSQPNGLLQQTFASIPGRSYVLTFDVGILSYIRGSQTMEIRISSANAGPWRFSELCNGLGGIEWHELMIPFTAGADPTVITFQDISTVTRSIDLLLDDVRLKEIPPDYALVDPGSFTMGSPESELGHGYYEMQHTVSFQRHLLVKRTELTWSEWSEVRAMAAAHGYTDLSPGRNGYAGGPQGDHPVTEVSWWDAIKWCNLKSELEGLPPAYHTAPDFSGNHVLRVGKPAVVVDWNSDGYRLPTESEWEHFCRAGTSSAYFTGPMLYLHGEPEPNLEIAGWYSDNSGFNTHPVASKLANPWGIHDTHGNVWEWCWDWHTDFYPPGPVTDPKGPASGEDRVIRGGSFHMLAYWCRSAQQAWHTPDAAWWYLGFRPVRTLTR